MLCDVFRFRCCVCCFFNSSCQSIIDIIIITKSLESVLNSFLTSALFSLTILGRVFFLRTVIIFHNLRHDTANNHSNIDSSYLFITVTCLTETALFEIMKPVTCFFSSFALFQVYILPLHKIYIFTRFLHYTRLPRFSCL